MGEKTRSNVYEAFVGEAKAYHRLLAFARKADEEEYEQIAKLFRAIATAEGVHAERHLRLMGDAVVQGTEENLQSSFDRETSINEVYYPRFIREAEEEGERAAAVTFTHARDVEEGHAELYKRALSAMLRDEDYDYHVCRVCGYVAERDLPDQCPICGAKRERFVTVGECPEGGRASVA
ncbi:MAG: rubrerythrin family protein [Anaerolineae bacterium]|nr:rubrerythrin family protein [Anaerolineae bacterium]